MSFDAFENTPYEAEKLSFSRSGKLASGSNNLVRYWCVNIHLELPHPKNILQSNVLVFRGLY